jgi:molybdate transport system ATP-binding protein
VRIGPARILAAEPLAAAQSVFVCIRAEDVTLESVRRDAVSVRNQLDGRVVAIQAEGAFVRITVDCGFLLAALVTRSACDELHLAEGLFVVAAVKATAVHLVPRSAS